MIPKCARSSMKFMGRLVQDDGVKQDPDNIRAFREIEPHNNNKKVCQLMEMANYLSQFSANLVEGGLHIYTVTVKNSK